MLRTILLTMQNEARLLWKDPVALPMLLLAPIVIIVVAGYSLGNIYGRDANVFVLPIVDHDQREVGATIVAGLRGDPSLKVELLDNVDDARRIVSRSDRAPIAIEIPAGTTEAIEAGSIAHLILYVDPVKRIESNSLELQIDDLCMFVGARAQWFAQERLAAAAARLKKNVADLSAAIRREQTQARLQMEQTRAAEIESLHAQIAAALERASKETEALIRTRESQAQSDLRGQLSERQAILERLQRYLLELRASRQSFEEWIKNLKVLAGSHASDIPAPPVFPAPPSDADLAELTKPIAMPPRDHAMPNVPLPDASAIKVPKLPAPGDDKLLVEIDRLGSAHVLDLPGELGFVEQAAIEGGEPDANAFDQYVPGFGVTFLLIGMLLGISMTLFDERAWGTLKRLQVSGAPLTGILLGKLIARFLVGTVQMVVLFAIGWALFGISLGLQPAALLLPMTAMSFAAATFGLVIASIARAHDSLMPLGTVASMTMSAIGGCWWPLDFEPAWLRAVARWLPTTWTMQAFNDLMIRGLPGSAALQPFAITLAIGVVFLAAGILGMKYFGD